VSRDTRIAARRIGPGGVVEHELDVHMQNVQRLIAAHIARIGLQEPVQLPPARHDRITAATSSAPASSPVRYMLATNSARKLTSRVEHRLADRVARRPQPRHHRVERDAVDHGRDEHHPLPFGQLLLDRLPHRRAPLR
jgi:hypothetical protein